jgi:lysophospholipid acyltransferase (LPLAT)-like uncharacterized protein
MVAAQSGLAIVPIGIGFARAWRVGSWDRFAVPCPCSTVTGVMGEPISVPADLDRGGMKLWTQIVEDRLLALTVQAESWAARLRREGRRAAPPEFSRPALPLSA